MVTLILVLVAILLVLVIGIVGYGFAQFVRAQPERERRCAAMHADFERQRAQVQIRLQQGRIQAASLPPDITRNLPRNARR